MALFNIIDRDNGIKVGDLITAYHKGYWTVTSIEQRVVTKDEEERYQGRAGDPINSIIHYELAFDSKFKPSGKKKKTNACDASYCRKVDAKFIADQIKELNSQVDALCNFAQAAHAIKAIEEWPIKLLSLGHWQSSFATQKVAEWLKVGGTPPGEPTHSALLQRLFSGKPPLDKAPPLNMSYPWYELGEGNKIELDPELNREVTLNGTKVSFGNTGPFEWVNQKEGIVVHPPSGERFKVWKEGKKRFIQKVDSNANN